MKKVFLFVLYIALIGCDDDISSVDLTVYNPDLGILDNLNNGVSNSDLVSNVSLEALFGIEYGGGFIFHYDQTDGSLLVATDYSQVGDKRWGDIFDLDTSSEINSGMENTELIVQGNLNDNSPANGGLEEFGSDDYIFKIVSDLQYNGFNDWFVPSSGSMEAIYSNVHSLGNGNFNETLTYWSSTKEGYFPHVMSFDIDFGGQSFNGLCTEVNGILIARKVE